MLTIDKNILKTDDFVLDLRQVSCITKVIETKAYYSYYYVKIKVIDCYLFSYEVNNEQEQENIFNKVSSAWELIKKDPDKKDDL